MKRIGILLCIAVAVAAPLGARAQGVDPFLKPASSGAPESGVSLALSIGYAIPMGNIDNTAKVSDFFSGGLPLQVDIGWRFTPNLYLGAFFEYSFAFLSSNVSATCSAAPGVSCSGGNIQFGVDFVYTFMPFAKFAPYVGLGVGWEIATFSVSSSTSSQSSSLTLSGFQFARFIVGGDFRVGSAFRVGPFVNFSLGQYSSVSSTGFAVTLGEKSLHEWLQFGVKGTVDL
jgi:opacity protein-like surface antigen